MANRKLLKIGVAGTAATAVCCFTPALVMLFGAVGLSAFVGYLDYALLPALILFLGLTMFALWKRKIPKSG